MKNDKINNQLIYPLNDLIKKETMDNKLINGIITNIDNNNLEVSIDKPVNITNNSPVEINKEEAILLKNNNKQLILEIKNSSNFYITQEVSIHNIQKHIIIHKLQELKTTIEDNKINTNNKETLAVLFDKYQPTYINCNITNFNNLNKNQKIAVKKSVSCNKFHIIQGPPGTGKTHTIVEIIKQLYKQNLRILLTAHTHIALDNIIEKLDTIPSCDILRLGNKSKISNNTLKYTIDEHIKEDILYEQILKRETEIKYLQHQSEENFHFNLTEKYDESLLSKIFNKLIPTKNMKDSHQQNGENTITTKYNNRIYELEVEIEKIKENIQSNLLKKIPIIASTVLSSSSYLTKNIEFDYVIMDEASQVPLYLALIPLMKTNKFILIGDDKQLQPITNNNASLLLNKSIFNLLVEKYSQYPTFLNVQYRMNKQISDISSKLYYNNQLKTYSKIKNQQIKLEHTNILLNNSPVTYIDTANMNYNEANISGGCCNKYESELVLSLVVSLINMNFNEESIGIITPYRKHKLYIQKLLEKENISIETDTIYRFQGREKDIILMCFCKSFPGILSKFQDRFLSNKNQLNVSITRSRKKIIIIGDSSVFAKSENIKNLFYEISPLNTIYLSDFLDSS